MNLDSPNFENEYVRLEVMGESHRKMVQDSNLLEAVWDWAPVLVSGANVHAYFDGMIQMKDCGRLVPLMVFRQTDGAFCGISAFNEFSRIHRRVRIDYAWHPENFRGTVIGPATQLALLTRAQACRIRRIELLAADDNDRWRSAIQRLGARCEGTMRSYCRVASGMWANIELYSLVGDEVQAAIDFLKDRIKALRAA